MTAFDSFANYLRRTMFPRHLNEPTLWTTLASCGRFEKESARRRPSLVDRLRVRLENGPVSRGVQKRRLRRQMDRTRGLRLLYSQDACLGCNRRVPKATLKTVNPKLDWKVGAFVGGRKRCPDCVVVCPGCGTEATKERLTKDGTGHYYEVETPMEGFSQPWTAVRTIACRLEAE